MGVVGRAAPTAPAAPAALALLRLLPLLGLLRHGEAVRGVVEPDHLALVEQLVRDCAQENHVQGVGLLRAVPVVPAKVAQLGRECADAGAGQRRDVRPGADAVKCRRLDGVKCRRSRLDGRKCCRMMRHGVVPPLPLATAAAAGAAAAAAGAAAGATAAAVAAARAWTTRDRRPPLACHPARQGQGPPRPVARADALVAARSSARHHALVRAAAWRAHRATASARCALHHRRPDKQAASKSALVSSFSSGPDRERRKSLTTLLLLY